MMRHSAREKGFTLVELLVAIPIMALVGLAAAGVLIQLLHSNRISGEVVAQRQAQYAGDSVCQDGKQAQYVTIHDNITANPTSWYLNLSWNTSWTDSDGAYNTRSENITYTLLADGSLYKLQRHEVGLRKSGSNPAVSTDTTLIVGRYLDRTQMSCYWTDSKSTTFVYKVTSVVGTKTEQRTYNVTPRP